MISGVLNDTFVDGLLGLVPARLPVTMSYLGLQSGLFKKRFAATSFFFVAADMYSRSFCEVFSVANVNILLSVN